jgi:hypothetical protein
MAAVKERIVVAEPKLKSESDTESKWSTNYRLPPGPPPRGGGPGPNDGGRKPVYIFLAILLAIMLSRVTATSYSMALGNTPQSQVIEFAAWLLLIVTFANVSVFAEEPNLSPRGTVEREMEKLKNRTVRRFWDGLFIVVVCFHIAAYTDVAGMVPLIEAASAFITVAYIIERVRLQFYPQSAADVADILS